MNSLFVPNTSLIAHCFDQVVICAVVAAVAHAESENISILNDGSAYRVPAGAFGAGIGDGATPQHSWSMAAFIDKSAMLNSSSWIAVGLAEHFCSTLLVHFARFAVVNARAP